MLPVYLQCANRLPGIFGDNWCMTARRKDAVVIEGTTFYKLSIYKFFDFFTIAIFDITGIDRISKNILDTVWGPDGARRRRNL